MSIKRGKGVVYLGPTTRGAFVSKQAAPA